ncbi:extracellular solute-binding protein [Rubrobacter marinus]|uniref:Extracellular solute-binding protein n=1 Tax=Rubrobacter marinus TaxID=2653852 RepID=A0A6G8PUA5_9ACTN|nr:extracellular solute-binding protein [Rubrobacter marinus]
MLAGCGGGGAGRPGELSLWSNLEEDGQAYFPENVERPFERANPGIDLAVTYQPPEDLDRLVRIALQGGQGPDLIPTPGPAYARDYVDANMFAALDEYAERYGWRDKMLGWALDLGRFGENLYVVPNQFQTMLLFYNRTLMEEKGWEPPTDREELEGLAEEAMGQGIVPFAAGIGDEPPAVEWFPTVFWNHYSGPEALYAVLTGEASFTDPIFVEAIDLFARYVGNGWFGGSTERFFSNGFDAFHAEFGDGGAAMNMEGSWLMSNIDQFFGDAAGNGNDWDWAPLPPLREGVPPELYELGIGSTLSINSASEDPEAAAKFIDYLFSDTARATRWMADVPSAFNVPIPLQESDFPPSMDDRVARHLAALSQATEGGNFGYTAWTFWPAKSELYLYEEIQKVLTADMTPAEYCAGLDEVFREDMEEGEVPPILEPRNA